MEFLELKQITEVEDVEGLCSYTPEVADLGSRISAFVIVKKLGWYDLRLSQFSKIVPIKMAYLRYAVCGCCLCIKNANCYKIGLALYKIRTKLKSSSRRPLPFTEMWWAGAFLRCGNVARKIKKVSSTEKMEDTFSSTNCLTSFSILSLS